MKTDFLISPAYQDALGEVHQDGAIGGRAVELRIGLEARQVQDGEFRLEALEFLRLGTQEHVAGEEIVPRGLVDDAHADAMGGIGAGPAVAHEQVAALRIGDHAVVEGAIAVGCDGLVGLAPVDAALALGILDDELVVGRATGMDAGANHQRAAIGHHTFMPANRFLVERRNLEVPVDIAQVLETEHFQSNFGYDEARLMHSVSPAFRPIRMAKVFRHYCATGRAAMRQVPCDKLVSPHVWIGLRTREKNAATRNR